MKQQLMTDELAVVLVSRMSCEFKPEEALMNSRVLKRDEHRTNVKDNASFNNIMDTKRWWNSGDGPKYRVTNKECKGPEADKLFSHNKQLNKLPFSIEKSSIFTPLKNASIIDKGKKIKRITSNYKGIVLCLEAYEYDVAYRQDGANGKPNNFTWPIANYLELGTLYFKTNRYH